MVYAAALGRMQREGEAKCGNPLCGHLRSDHAPQGCLWHACPCNRVKDGPYRKLRKGEPCR